MNDTNDQGFVLAASATQSVFSDDVYAHLGALSAVEFSRPGSDAQSGAFILNASKYQSLEQAAFEEAPRMEAQPPRSVNWAQIDESVSAFEANLVQSLTGVDSRTDPRPFIEFSSKCYENWLTYEQMYPARESTGINPWARTVRMMKVGLLLVIDDEARLDRHRKQHVASAIDAANVMALVRGAAPKPTAMAVDDRFAVQAKVLAFLKTHAKGHDNKIPLRVIREHLRSSLGIAMKEAQIQIRLTTPLKKSGVVGSSGKGFFFIDSEEDLIKAYCFHLTKVQSADKIMSRYRARAWSMNRDLNLEDECGSSNQILNRKL